MFATISRKLRDRRGMTLIELVVVMSILAILVVAALPAYRGSRDRAYLAEARQVAQEFKTLAWGYFIENATFAGLTADAIGFTAARTAPSGPTRCLRPARALRSPRPDWTGTATRDYELHFTVNEDGSVSECGNFAGLTACGGGGGDGVVVRTIGRALGGSGGASPAPPDRRLWLNPW
jgi:prepilin-type N-terminal cleavage/methylation domain-containing protein